MFTGIIETVGTVTDIRTEGTNQTFFIKSAISKELKADQSVSHNGVCLTVEQSKDGIHQVTAIHETLSVTTLKHWKKGDAINLERCLLMSSRLDGHFVQGHVDATAVCESRKDLNGSIEFVFRYPSRFAKLVIEKGSISLNGISLTVFDVSNDRFTVAIIPYTLENTSMGALCEGDEVNIEFDLIGKYINRAAETRD